MERRVWVVILFFFKVFDLGECFGLMMSRGRIDYRTVLWKCSALFLFRGRDGVWIDARSRLIQCSSDGVFIDTKYK